MDTGGEGVVAGPDDFAFRSDFDHGDTGVGGVAADDGVSIGQSLAATGVAEESIDVGVVNFPDDFALLVQFNDFVSVCERHEGVTVIKADGGEGPVFSRSAADGFEVSAKSVNDAAVGSIFLDGEGEQMGYKEVTAAKLAGHAGLHVCIVGLGLQGNFVDDNASGADFEQSGFGSKFGDEGIAVVQPLGRTNFAVGRGEFVAEDNGVIAGEFFDAVIEGNQYVAIGKDEPIAGATGRFPDRLAIFADDGGFRTKDEHGMLDVVGICGTGCEQDCDYQSEWMELNVTGGRTDGL